MNPRNRLLRRPNFPATSEEDEFVVVRKYDYKGRILFTYALT